MTVHPRMRGERMPIRSCWYGRIGSSPHARGTPLNDCIEVFDDRFIPACAGNAFPRFWMRFRTAVHPRMRGERSSRIDSPRRSAGSSPHARGTHLYDVAIW